MTSMRLLAIALSVFASATAFAAAKTDVYINLSLSFANGALGGVYNSGDPIQVIGCELNTFTGRSVTSSVQCYAIDKIGLTVSCYRNAPPLQFREALQSIGSDSIVSFAWDANGLCTGISVYHRSSFPPKAP